MRLGIASRLTDISAKDWAKTHSDLGLSCVVFPIKATDDKQRIKDFYNAAKDYNLCIAEVGIWKNYFDNNKDKARENIDFAVRTCEMADEIDAKCVVNIVGSFSPLYWDGGDIKNYSQEAFDRTVDVTKKIIERSGIKKTKYTLEPMPWMLPYDAESYLNLINAVDDKNFGVHMDMVNMINCPEKYYKQVEFMDGVFDKLGKHIVSCHLKDVTISNKLPCNISECELFEGSFNIEHYLSLCNKVDKDMTVIIEHLETNAQYINAVKKVLPMVNAIK